MFHFKKLYLLLTVLAASFAFPLVASAEEITLSSDRDTFANEAYPDKVWGSYQVVTVSNETINRFGYFHFQEINLPTGVDSVSKAVVRLYIYSTNYGTFSRVDVGPIRESWDESGTGGLTWNNRPDVWVDHTGTQNLDLASTGWKEFDVTSIVNKWLRGEIENHGVFIYPAGYLYGTSGGDFAMDIRTREAAENQPQLVVTYSPAPTATPTLEPTPEPTPEPTTSPAATDIEETLEATETPSLIATSETETDEPDEEAEEPEATSSFSFQTKDFIIGGICIVLALMAGVAFSFAFLKKDQKKKKSEDPEE